MSHESETWRMFQSLWCDTHPKPNLSTELSNEQCQAFSMFVGQSVFRLLLRLVVPHTKPRNKTWLGSVFCLFHQSGSPASVSLERLSCLNSQTHQQETANALLTLSACVRLWTHHFSPPATVSFSRNQEKVSHCSESVCSCGGAQRYSSVIVQCHSLQSPALYPVLLLSRWPRRRSSKTRPSRIQIYTQQKSLCKSKRIVWR